MLANIKPSPQEQQKLLESDSQFRSCSRRQEQLRDRLKDFNSRSPEQQQRILDRMQKFENLSMSKNSSYRTSISDA